MSAATRRRATGPLVDAGPARQHVLALMAAGAGYRSIASAAGVAISTINHMLYIRGTKPRTERLATENAQRILAVRLERVATGLVDPTGATRRLQALMAIGWPPSHLGHRLGLHPHYVCEIQRNNQIYASTAHAVATTYNALWNKEPTAYGVSRQAATRFRNQARANGWAPPAAWDEDIDNPDALPDWTGYCGTDRGWHAHHLTGVPACPACRNAHDQWLVDHAHLDGRSRTQAVFAARASANDRGITLAEDIRELLGRSYDREQICERLQISRDVLQATLTRHPEPGADQDEDVAA